MTKEMVTVRWATAIGIEEGIARQLEKEKHSVRGLTKTEEHFNEVLRRLGCQEGQIVDAWDDWVSLLADKTNSSNQPNGASRIVKSVYLLVCCRLNRRLERSMQPQEISPVSIPE